MSVGIYDVKKYNEELINVSLNKIFEDFKLNEKIKDNMNVVIKPDLTIGDESKDYTATNYLLIKLIAKKLIKLGAKVSVCDRTDGKFNNENIEEEYKKLNVGILEDAGIRLNRNTDVHSVKLELDGIIDEINFIDELTDSDYIINVPKLKTHTMFGLSGAIYNMFGCITSDSIKMLYEKYPERDKMSKIAVAIANRFKNQMIIVDGVEAMQGNGPSSGDLVKMGAIIASDNMYEVDYVLASKVFKNIKDIPIINELILLNKVPNINIINDRQLKTLKLPENLKKLSFLDKISRRNYVPYIDSRKCIKCRICVVRCPMDVIHEKNHSIVMDERQRCTKCMYCVSQCPTGAIKIIKAKDKFKNNMLNSSKEKER